MTLTDPQYKTLLDAQAIARHVQNIERQARNTAMNCADGIERLIEQCERLDKERKEIEATAPF